MKLKISKTSVYMNGKSNGSEYEKGPAGEAYRPAIISDACGHMQPTRRNPGGFVGVWDYSGSGDTKKSPTSKPGNAGGKRII
jgi:hypothetical protein